MKSTAKVPTPAFVGIGMTKSGTSWLDAMLRLHPDIWMPPVKELHFFNDYFLRVRNGDQSRYFSGDFYSRNRWRRYLKTEIKRALRYPRPSNIVWAARFLAQPRGFNQYRSLFAPGEGKVCGEVTPAYAVLPREYIDEIHDEFPHLRLLILLRNPVERAWSHAKMELAGRRGRRVDEVGPEEVEALLFQDVGMMRRGEYAQILRNWIDAFGLGNLHVAFYDDVRDDPLRLLRGIFEFIGVDPSQAVRLPVNQVVFPGRKGEIPLDMRERLQAHFRPRVHELAELLDRPGLVEMWT